MRVATGTLAAAAETLRQDAMTAWTEDPIFDGLRRNRVNAELLKASLLLPASRAEACGFGAQTRYKLAMRLLRTQSPVGSWNEIHPAYDRPSPMVTAFIAEALTLLLEREPGVEDRQRIEDATARAASYVLANEVRPGFFLKSEGYRADHLNADAAVGAFLAAHAARTMDEVAAAGAARARDHVVRQQLVDGAWPYTTSDPGEPYPTPLDVRCIHYQGVTGYYLAKLADHLPSADSDEALLRAARWLATARKRNGRFDWGKSHLGFALGLSGAYAFGAALFARAGMRREAEDCVAVLESERSGLAWRWERASKATLLMAPLTAVRAARGGNFPLKERALRVGYGLYREVARRRQSQKVDARLFHTLRRGLRLNASTVDPSANYPDLFMSAEIADALGWVAAREAK